MSLIQKIIDFFLGLFGMKKSAPPQLAAPPAVAASSSSSSSSASDTDDDDDDKPIDRQKYAQEQWAETQQGIARFEAGSQLPAGLTWNDPVAFWMKAFGVEEAQMKGKDNDAAARENGFRGYEHFVECRDYVTWKWSVLGTNSDGQPDVVVKDEYTNAMMKARMGQHQAAQAAAANADPTLLQPEDGVTVEAWAGASANLAQLPQNATMAQVAEVLARFGLDKARYDKANLAWQAKMQRDTTAVIATKFGEAFAAAQGQGAGAGEPCTFEKFCEVMAAQAMWAEQGLDVNAQLRAVFGINAAEYSKYSSYWSPKMATDIAMVNRQQELDRKYRAKYQGAASTADDDLSL
ncbi:MAG: hypothetical protein HYV09_24185 [Deltaproteobacteria bacterium]|nr:hypothetical protein [Deltaproteobacteria bacterium]